MFIEDRVNGCTVENGIFGEMRYRIIDSLLAGNYRRKYCLCRSTFCEQSLIGKMRTDTGCKHGINKNKSLAVKTRRCQIFNNNIKLVF